MSRFAEQTPERQVPWLPGERFELALDSREGAVNSIGGVNDTLTITTHRIIRLGNVGGAKTTEVIPLHRLTAVQVIDVARDNQKLNYGLLALVAGAAIALISWFVTEHMFFPLVLGGLPTLAAVYLLTGWLFPDDEGALLLHSASYAVRQPLLTEQARRDAYLVAHRIYELMDRIGMSIPVQVNRAEPSPQTPPSPYLGESPRAAPPSSPNGASRELSSIVAAPLSEDRSALVPDIAERIARSIEKTGAATSYATHQIVRDPGHDGNAPGDYVWDMEYVAPDRYRVAQVGWSESGEVHERWLIVGKDFYRDAQGTWRLSEDPTRFAAEQAVTYHLSPNKYLKVLRQGYPSRHEVDSGGGRRYLQVSYDALTREALAAVLANPSPPQGVIGSAKVWIDMDTDLLAKAEVDIAEREGDRRLRFEQAFASYNADLDVAPPSLRTSRPGYMA